jgi:hypothetical protein
MRTTLAKLSLIIAVLTLCSASLLGSRPAHAQQWRSMYNQQYKQWREEFNQEYREWCRDVNNYGPYYEYALATTTLVRFKNLRSSAVKVEFHSEGQPLSLVVPPRSLRSIRVPNGRHEIFLRFANEPRALYRGDDLDLNGEANLFQIGKVTSGNYKLRRVE